MNDCAMNGDLITYRLNIESGLHMFFKKLMR